MRRSLLLAILVGAMVPAAVAAQPRFIVGGGFTAPAGDLGSTADPGYHVGAGLHIALPTLPVGVRGDGVLHRLGAANATLDDTSVLAGSLSLVFSLPGIGMQPYFLGGVGSYRTKSGLAGASTSRTDTGYHAGFGVLIGVGVGGFAEIRYVRLDDPANTTWIPLTLGLRL